MNLVNAPPLQPRKAIKETVVDLRGSGPVLAHQYRWSSAPRKVPALQFHFILVSKCKQRECNQREQTSGAGKQAQRTLEAPGTKTLPVIPLRGDFLQVEFLNSDLL